MKVRTKVQKKYAQKYGKKYAQKFKKSTRKSSNKERAKKKYATEFTQKCAGKKEFDGGKTGWAGAQGDALGFTGCFPRTGARRRHGGGVSGGVGSGLRSVPCVRRFLVVGGDVPSGGKSRANWLGGLCGAIPAYTGFCAGAVGLRPCGPGLGARVLEPPSPKRVLRPSGLKFLPLRGGRMWAGGLRAPARRRGPRRRSGGRRALIPALPFPAASPAPPSLRREPPAP
jgi:hypothetical protein